MKGFFNWVRAALLVLVCYCCRAEEDMVFSKGTGDIGHYIIQQALKFGARGASTNNLPPINGDWKYSEDQYGIVLQLEPDKFEDVRVFLQKAFGPPAHEPSETTTGGKLGWYSAKKIGIALQFEREKERTQVIVLRPQKGSEVFKRAAEKATSEEDKELYKRRSKEEQEKERKARIK